MQLVALFGRLIDRQSADQGRGCHAPSPRVSWPHCAEREVPKRVGSGVVTLAILLAGCGAASPGAPSGRDPAKLAPASSLVYLSLTVRPQGNQAAQTAALHKLFGNSADSSIRKTVDGLLGKIGTSYGGNVRPWLGQRIGLVVTQLAVSGSSGGGKSGVAVIAPTQDPSAARAFVAKLVRRNPGEEGKVTDGYAVFGGAVAARQILSTTPASSLASNPSYQATTSQLGNSTVAMVYVSLRRFAQQLSARMSKAGASAGQLKQFLSRIGTWAGAAGGLTLTPSAVRIDTVESGVRQSAHPSHANVGELPAGSWLALATGGLAPGTQKQLEAGLRLGLLGGSPGEPPVPARWPAPSRVAWPLWNVICCPRSVRCRWPSGVPRR